MANTSDPFIQELMKKLYGGNMNWRESGGEGDMTERWPTNDNTLIQSTPSTQAMQQPSSYMTTVQLRHGVANIEVIDGQPVFRGWAKAPIGNGVMSAAGDISGVWHSSGGT